jgi:hypothetical protein
LSLLFLLWELCNNVNGGMSRDNIDSRHLSIDKTGGRGEVIFTGGRSWVGA